MIEDKIRVVSIDKEKNSYIVYFDNFRNEKFTGFKSKESLKDYLRDKGFYCSKSI